MFAKYLHCVVAILYQVDFRTHLVVDVNPTIYSVILLKFGQCFTKYYFKVNENHSQRHRNNIIALPLSSAAGDNNHLVFRIIHYLF